MPLIKVALDVPIPTLFDYRCETATQAQVGSRVSVPFGRKQMVGVIIEVGTQPSLDPSRIRDVTEILPDAEPLPRDLLELLRFCSDYYHHPIGEAVLGALPPRSRSTRLARRQVGASIEISPEGHAALRDSALDRSPALLRVLTRLASSCSLEHETIRTLPAADRHALKGLLDRGLAQTRTMPAKAIVPAAQAGKSPTLTDEQQAAVNAITANRAGYRCWLLHGITGSGKTEVYLHVMARVLAASGQILFLVPEIGLTPQLEARISSRFPDQCLVTLHSGLTGAQRAANWVAAQAGEAHIVLGTRSAIFTPLPALALIVVDEEHDTSFKQIEAMRYSARDLAVWRGRQRDVPVVLGSATPSLETYHSALSGRYGLVRLTQRPSSGVPPRISLIPTAGDKLVGGFAPALLAAINNRIRKSEQVLVYINRRGYAPVLVCSACCWAPSCHRCSARMVLHKARPHMVCHHCGHEESVPAACADCGNVDLRPLGYGTQRVEVSLRLACPSARLLRIDRDTTRGRDVWKDMRVSIERQEIDILVGTQLLSKGHDFPGLALVCVLNADRSLYSTDFRASEQLFAQLMQVAGRAGRGSVRGEVLIQTAFPMHPLYRAVQAHDYEAFARTLLDERRQAGFPPFVYQAVLRADATRIDDALQFLNTAVAAAAPIADGVTLFDPAPAAMQRLKGRERAQLLVQSNSRAQLHRFLGRWSEALRSVRGARARWAIDVDPIDV